MLRVVVGVLIAVIGSAVSQSARAEPRRAASASFTVRLTVARKCTVTTTTQADRRTTRVNRASIGCTAGTPYSVALSGSRMAGFDVAGSGYIATGRVRPVTLDNRLHAADRPTLTISY